MNPVNLSRIQIHNRLRTDAVAIYQYSIMRVGALNDIHNHIYGSYRTPSIIRNHSFQ